MTLLAAWLWQGTAIAVAMALVLARRRGFAAATRHAMWWVALVAVVLLPVAYVVAAAIAREPAAIVADLPVAASAVPLPAAPAWALPVILYAWITLALGGLLRIAASVWTLHRLKGSARPLAPGRLAKLRMWNATEHRRRPPHILVSAEIRGACALGLGRPVILLSPAVLALDDERLDGVVLHEQAHLSRFDDWTQLVHAVIASVFVLHPAVWFIGRHIHIEREAACDDVVVRRGAAARDYARSLVDVAATRLSGWNAAAIPGAVRSRSILRRRVQRILDASRPRDHQFGVRATAAAAVVMMLAVALSANTPSVVVFIDGHVTAPPVEALARLGWYGAGPGTLFVTPVESAQRTPVRQASPVQRPGQPQPAAERAVTATPQPPLAVAPLSPSRPVPQAIAALPPSTLPAPGDAATPAADRTGPWTAIARGASSAGKSTGSGARTAGSSIGRFFGRTGQAIVDRF